MRWPPVHFPFLRAATCLSRVRSEMISRSNCANDNRMLSVRRPRDDVRVELLRDGDEADAVLLEQLHHLGEVDQRSAEAIDFVDDHAVDLAGLDVGQQLSQRRAVRCSRRCIRRRCTASGTSVQPSLVWLRMYASAASR